MSNAARIALIGGQGWPLTETAAGLPRLQQRLSAQGVEVQTFAHEARQAIHDWLHGHSGFRALIGDSLGAGAAALYSGDLDGAVDFAGGFQPSAWDPIGQGPITNREIVVAKNVQVAHCIWDPVVLDTGGLGNAHYVVSPGAKTKLTLTQHSGPHPDDWGYSQDLMLDHVMLCIKQAAANGQASAQTIVGQASGQVSGDLIVPIKQLLDGLQKGADVQIPTLPVPANDLTSTLQQVGNILQKLNINVAAISTRPIPMAPPQGQAVQLQKILDFVSGLINPSGNSQPLGQVNGALGETIGDMLDGKKTAIGAVGGLLTAWLSNVHALPAGATPSGLFGVIQLVAGSVPGLSGFSMPLFLALTAWGVLGKLEKWAQGTAPPPTSTK
jgi:hypothetical protein